jgi:hypothetical protein
MFHSENRGIEGDPRIWQRYSQCEWNRRSPDASLYGTASSSLLHGIRVLPLCLMLEKEQKKGKKDACWLGVLPVLAYRRQVNAEQIGQFPGSSSDILCDLGAC